MTNAEALRVVAMFAAYFRQELSDETAMLWAREMTPYELQDAMEAARVLGLVGGFNFTIAALTEATRDERNHRVMAERTALPGAVESVHEFCTFAEFLAAHPEMRERVWSLGIWRDVLATADEAAKA